MYLCWVKSTLINIIINQQNQEMKKFYILLVMIIGMSVAVNAQIFVEENFEDLNMPPDGWSFDGYANQWGISASVNAGGSAPEGRFTHITANSTSRLVGPEVDLSGLSSIMLGFKHKVFNNTGTGYSVGIATRSNGGDWNIAWEVNPDANIGPEGQMVSIANSDVGNSDFQFCFFVDGNLSGLDYWYIDDIKLFVPLEIDAEMVEITTESSIYNAAEVTGIIKNVGETDITELEIKWQVPGEDINTTTISGLSIASAESYEFTSDILFFFPAGEYDLNVWISKLNGVDDMNPDDNSTSKEITVIENLTTYRTPFFEEFTASTCGPCAGFNQGFVPWCNDHVDEIALLKYQMNWPGSGDPYYTAEGGVRRTYYNVSGVPDLFGNGGAVSTSVSAANAFFNQASQLPGYISIAGDYTVTGTSIEINANILPYQDFPTLRLYVAVFEYLTTGNVGSNGETEFENVMMKMVPDASGTNVDLTNMEIYEFSQTIDLAGTFVEDYNDLGVVFFLQNNGSKEIHQAAYGLEDYAYSADARLSEIRVSNIPIEGFDPDVTTYSVALTEDITELVPVTGKPFAGKPVITYEYPDVLPGDVIISVRAEDLTTTNTYTVSITPYTGIEDAFAKSVNIYPNPTSGMIYINGVEDANVTVFTISGKMINTTKISNGNAIDLSSLTNGIYLIKVQKDGNTMTKKISLNR
jgi:hypothetical protein